MFYSILKHTHSGFRWLVLFGLIISIIVFISQIFKTGDPKIELSKRIALITLIFSHLQLLFGLILYFVSPKVQFSQSALSQDVIRFFTVKHSLLMILAIFLITMGYTRSKKIGLLKGKLLRLLIFYSIALILILAAIPWPFGKMGGLWF